MNATKIRSKSRLIAVAIKNYAGKLELDIDIEALRAR
jgi:hypothetical protein